jgi:hypothetical protein
MQVQQTQADKWGRNVTWWHEAARQAALGGGGQGQGGKGCAALQAHTTQTKLNVKTCR